MIINIAVIIFSLIAIFIIAPKIKQHRLNSKQKIKEGESTSISTNTDKK